MEALIKTTFLDLEAEASHGLCRVLGLVNGTSPLGSEPQQDLLSSDRHEAGVSGSASLRGKS